MKKKLLAVVIFTITTITPMFTISAFADTMSQVQASKAQQEQQAQQAQQQLEKLDNQIQNSMIQANQLDGKINEANANIKSYQDQISQTQTKLEQSKVKMDQEIAGLYKSGYANNGLLAYLNALFSGNSFSQIVTNLEDVYSINQSNQKTLNQIKAQEDQLKSEQASLQSNVQTLENSKTAVAKNLNDQNDAKNKEQGILSQAQNQVAKLSQQEIQIQQAQVQAALKADQAKAEAAAKAAAASKAAAEAKAEASSNSAAKASTSTSAPAKASTSSSSNTSSNSSSKSSSNSSQTMTVTTANGNEQESVGNTQYVPNNSQASGSAQAIISYGEQFIGVPYVWGGESPSGFDCSGLMQYIFGHNGVSLPRTSEAQQECGTPVAKGNLQPGDLVFWGEPAYHVAVYIGNGQILVAPHTGAYVTVMNLYPYTNARRVL
ncbi:C40 family peptidase [uncultured Clostridium sp.]|uniref:C40 family peptidase n=1 Tax=uncultured Clostridium sp. TaxID=59620 RepID=UPI0026342990|nr:C40 family peptidase [uncultured Clostridium sp.]